MKSGTAIKFISSSKNLLVASNEVVYKLDPLPYDSQVGSCIQKKQFELALSIAVSGRRGRDGGRVSEAVQVSFPHYCEGVGGHRDR